MLLLTVHGASQLRPEEGDLCPMLLLTRLIESSTRNRTAGRRAVEAGSMFCALRLG